MILLSFARDKMEGEVSYSDKGEVTREFYADWWDLRKFEKCENLEYCLCIHA